jgi:hypothetical protein
MEIGHLKEFYHYFKENRESFAANPLYKNKYAIIHDRKMQGILDTFEAALADAVPKFPQNEFVIQQIILDDEIVNFLFPAVSFA